MDDDAVKRLADDVATAPWPDPPPLLEAPDQDAPAGPERKADPILRELPRLAREEGEPAARQAARDARSLNGRDEVVLTVVLSEEGGQAGQDVRAIVERAGGRLLGQVGTLLDIAVPFGVFVAIPGGHQPGFLRAVTSPAGVREVRVPPRGEPD